MGKPTKKELKDYIRERRQKGAEVTFLNPSITNKDLKEMRKLDKRSKINNLVRKILRGKF